MVLDEMNLCSGRLVGSMPLPGSNATRKPAVAALQFPAGLRVLVVDDDPTCLKILEKMLQACQYEVTKCDRAEYALNELRRNKNGFDIVLSDVHMPDMDGFKLLEHIGLEMDLPVIMMSADDSKNVVMKGVTHGACDYLIKPVRIEALKNIWQHVVRKKKKKKDWKDLEQSGSLDDGDSAQKQEDLEQSGSFDDGNLKSSKRKGDDEDNEDKDDSSSMKKPRVVWSVELHQQFVAAVNQLGIEKAVPKKILEMMNVPGLTRENVASHLQKYRLYLRRLSGVSQHQGGLNASFMSPHDAAFASMSPLGGIDLQTLAFAGQLPGQNLSGYQPGLARPGIKPGMSMPFVEQRNLFSFEASKLRFAEGQHLQQLSNSNKQMNLLHGIPTTMELKQLGGFHQSAQPLGSLNMHASSQGSQSNPILVQMVQPQARPGQLMNESSIGSQMSQIQSSNRQIVRPARASVGVLPRSGIADNSQATSYGSLDFSVNQLRGSFPLGSTPAVTTSEGLIQEEVNSNGKGPRGCGPNYNMFNELPQQKPQDWRSSALSYSVPQHTPSGPKIVDVSPSVLVNQGFSASQRPGQFVNTRAANNEASSPGTVLQQGSDAQTVNNPLINNAPSKVKAERDQELSSVNNLYPYQFAQDDLMSAILKQQEGIESVPGDFDFEGFTVDNIPV